MSENLRAKWGNEILDDGITNIPDCVAKYAYRFLNGGELSFVINLFSYKYNHENPYPSQHTIAENMGVNERQIRKWIGGLEEKGLIEVYERYNHKGRTSNEYSFNPLLNKCLEVARKIKEEKENEHIRVKRKKKTSNGAGKSVPARKAPEPTGLIGPPPTGPIGPEPPGLFGPTNQELESSHLNQELESSQSIKEQEIKESDLPDPIKNILLKEIDRLIDHNISIDDIYGNYKANEKRVDEWQYAERFKIALHKAKKKIGNISNYMNRAIDSYLSKQTQQPTGNDDKAPQVDHNNPEWYKQGKHKEKPQQEQDKPMSEEQRKVAILLKKYTEGAQ